MKKLKVERFPNYGNKQKLRVMKITLLFLTACLIPVSAAIYSDNTRFTADAYASREGGVYHPVNETNQMYSLGFNLENAVSQSDLCATVEEKDLLYPAQGQQQTISGKVTDASGNPLPGVTVVVQGTTQGTVTDANGEYRLTNVPSDATLVFSFIGMRTVNVKVGTQTTINVTMEEEAIGLQEVVAIGYGTQKRISVTAAISNVNTEDLQASPNASIANSLAGRITGISTVQSSGQPGADDPDIYIRGISSLNTSRSRPLILVDGVEREFTQLDPNEIESISILKDASATAVYGVRGANGVIIVTTRRGSTGAPQIDFRASAGLQQPTRLPKFADSYTYATYYNLAQTNDDPNATLKFSEEAIEAFRTGSQPIIYPNTDWIDYILKPAAFITQDNLNISGGTENVRYFVSFGYYRQDGLFKTFDLSDEFNYVYNRYNYRANLDVDVTKTSTISLTLGGRSEVRNEPRQNEPQFSIWRNIYFAQPYRGIGIVDGKHIISSNRYISGEERDALNGYYGMGYFRDNRNVLNTDLELTQKLDFLTEGLSFKIKGSYNSIYNYTKTRNYYKTTYSANYLHDLDPTVPKDDMTIVYKGGEDDMVGYYSESSDKDRDWYLETSFNYARDFDVHHFTALALYNQSKYYYPSPYPDIPLGYVGLVGRITYDYDYKYLLDLNVGYNGSENFAPGKRFGFFPSASVGWVLSEEPFMQNIPFIDYLKIRASYGLVGNDQLGGARFLYLPDSYIPSGRNYSFGVNNPQYALGAYEGTIGNPDVTWEKSAKQNYGIELNMLDNRFKIVADVFFENRTDILTTRNTVPAVVAINLPAMNIGEVNNHGYELAVTWSDKIGDFSYSLNPNISFARNKIIYMDEVPPNEPYLEQTGHPVGQPFLYIFDGFWTEEDVANYNEFPDASYVPGPGDLRYKDLNNDGVINVDDQMPSGYPTYPEYVFGMNMDFSYKNFTLHMLWSGAAHVSRQMWGTFQRPFGPTHSFGLMQFMVDGAWTPEKGDDAYYPRFTFRGTENNVKPSDFWQQDASYLRLKNIELVYNFDTSGWLERIGVSKLRLYVNGYDLLTFDKLKKYYIDPENYPEENTNYPIMAMYNFGINITF